MSKILTIDLILEKANNNNPKNIRALNLWGNKLSDISILSEFPSLEIISLSINQIKDISAFKKLKNVRELYLKDNEISDINQIENLKNCKKLEKLVLKDNPITNIINYRQKILEILPQLKKLDDIEVKQLKVNNNNNFNSPLAKKDSDQNNINNNYNIQSPNLKNSLSNKSGSESVSSERKSEARNDSAAPDPQTSLFPPHISGNLDNINLNLNIDDNNVNNGINNTNSFNAINLKMNNTHQKDKSDLLNRSFKKKITEGSFRKVKKKNNFNNNINQEEKKKLLIERAINDNKLRNEKLSQTISSGFYKNQFKKANEIGGYKKKIIGNFKQEQEHKENNKNKQNVINTVFQKYQYFDNDNDNDNENEEEKKKSHDSPKKDILPKKNQLIMISNKKNISLEKNKINNKNSIELNKDEYKIKDNGKEGIINNSVIESIKLLMTTLSLEGLKQIQNDIQKLMEEKK